MEVSKWLKAGVLEEGRPLTVERGTPQGAVISPLLANIYLHCVYDLWVQRWRRRCAQGDVIVVRYADDLVVGFQYLADAHRFLAELKQRLEALALECTRTRPGSSSSDGSLMRAAGLVVRASPNLRLTGLHPQIRADPGRQAADPAAHHPRAAERQAPAGRATLPPDEAPADSGAGALPAVGAERPLQLLRRPDQLPCPQRLLLPRALPLAAMPPATQPATKLTWRKMMRIAERWLPSPTLRHPCPDWRFDVMTRGRSPVR
jgi:RNA-directed DNA polymerase